MCDNREFPSIFSKTYWGTAAKQFTNTKMLAFGAIIVALRVALKFFEIPIGANLLITFDCYISSLGSLVYGPLMALASGAISDVLGAVLSPKGAFFPPFTLIEMLSSFLYALFFWKRTVSTGRVITAQFSVNLTCNIVCNSLCLKWMYLALGSGGTAYTIFNLSRIVKNLVMFPLESLLIVLVLQAAVPLLSKSTLGLNLPPLPPVKYKRLLLQIGVLTLLSVGLILLYVLFLKDFLTSHNLKFW